MSGGYNRQLKAEPHSNPSQAEVPSIQRYPFHSKVLSKTSLAFVLFNSIHIEPNEVLGFGKYGLVFKGLLQKCENEAQIQIAIKTMKSNTNGRDSVLYFKALLSDVTVAASLDTHPNIASFFGACVENIKKGDILIAVELCENGDLLSFLRKQKALLDGSILVSDDSESRFSESGSDHTNVLNSSVVNLFEWSRDIANGMSFLNYNNVIHGDLAARNVLLSKDNVAKIGDFGVSRQLLNDYFVYQNKSKVPLPWKWMAIESLTNSAFTLKSYVWSFGVTLWEIFSYRCIAYADYEYDANFVDLILSGYQLPMPEYATQEIYSVMKRCWKTSPESRPGITTVSSEIQDMLHRLRMSEENVKL